MASDVSINNALDFQQQSANSAAQLAEDFNEFLILLTTQLQNQDPLDPADTTEFTNQLVNFAGVEQQINANKKLDSLVSLTLGSAFASSLDYVGKNISYLSAEGYFDGETPIKTNFAVQGDATELTAQIYDEEGSLVYSEDLTPGDTIFTWDGKSANGSTQPAGTYEVRINAFDFEGDPLQTTTVVTGRVTGIETQNGTTFLLVGERAVSIGNIINVTEAPAPTAPETDETNETSGEGSEGEGSGEEGGATT